MPEQNLYKRAGVWWLRATINGREHRETLRTGDVKTARRLRDRRIEEIKQARHFGESKRSWFEAVAAWAEQIDGQLAPKTLKRYAVSLQQVEPSLRGLAIHEIDGRAIAGLIETRRKAGATPATVRRDLTAVSAVLEYAEAMGWREGNPTLSKRRILRERRDPIALPRHEDIEAVIAVASPLFAALIRAAWLTGCRQDELVTARWSRFDRKAGTLEVIGKGAKRRVIQLAPEAAAVIAGRPHTLGSDLIFCREGGEPIAQAASDFAHLRRAAEGRAQKEGREFHRFRFHDLRHLFAVEALRCGWSIYDVSKHLGHTSVKTTEIYTEFLTPEEAARSKQGSAQNPAQRARLA